MDQTVQLAAVVVAVVAVTLVLVLVEMAGLEQTGILRMDLAAVAQVARAQAVERSVNPAMAVSMVAEQVVALVCPPTERKALLS